LKNFGFLYGIGGDRGCKMPIIYIGSKGRSKKKMKNLDKMPELPLTIYDPLGTIHS
jgi:hypothetical protein